MAASSFSKRPAVKRTHHTEPTLPKPRSHFEDFLREIGESSEMHHLCCNPRQGCLSRHTPERPRHARSASEALASSQVTRGRLTAKEASAARTARMQTVSPQSTTTSTSTKSSTLFAPALKTPVSLKVEAALAIDLHVHEALQPPDLPRPSSYDAKRTLRKLLGNAANPQLSRNPIDRDAAPTISSDITSMTAEADHSAVPVENLRRSPSTDSLSTISSSEAPATPRNHSPLLGHDRPTLVDLEQQSRFRSSAVCVTCKRHGANFPSCSRCGETWCSRGCRLKESGGTRHHCHVRSITVRSPYPTIVS
ncbi:uncharacterized protein C8Q71DRAFT_737622 [Rhodofomes roseus]|uniref:HIT-type domain-containing protein n=1 Tax=Rhodofomes roseus TaxID=34475 RepID=A0ABQ8KTE7_9APHY|nr:uncharacterized protein C8Q71DRAFT_737622 [Rhodofomes roseus]KAH9841557.1 hypothetical protein C8Q71DRAFT_737622 [Rhodofomes roseus]